MFKTSMIGAAVLMLPLSAWAEDGQAFVYANRARAASYEAKSAYTHNPSSKSVNITRSKPGVYDVRLAGLGRVAKGGNVQVTSYGPGPGMCKVARWIPAGADLSVRVLCFEGTRPADSNFTVLFTPSGNIGSGPPVRYAWSGRPRSPKAAAQPKYASNAGQDVMVQRTAVGRYTVSFAGVPKAEAQSGNVQITAYGPGPSLCKVLSWTAGPGTMNVKAACFNDGRPADSAFTVLFTPGR